MALPTSRVGNQRFAHVDWATEFSVGLSKLASNNFLAFRDAPLVSSSVANALASSAV